MESLNIFAVRIERQLADRKKTQRIKRIRNLNVASIIKLKFYNIIRMK
jgi:hypothetical protein